MSIRKKTMLIVIFISICLIIVLFGAMSVIVGRGFLNLENVYTSKNVTQTVNALQDTVNELDTKINDWSNWDDTYQFIEDKNSDYIQSNLGDSTFTQLNINTFIFINKAHDVVYGKNYDSKDNSLNDISEDYKKSVLTAGFFKQFSDHPSGIKGLVMTPYGPEIISAKPILHSDGSGQSRGILIMGKYLDSTEINDLAKITRLSVEAKELNSSSLPQDYKNASLHLNNDSSVFVKPINNDTIAGYTFFNDIYGKPQLILKVNAPRLIYMQRNKSIKYVAFAMLLVIIVVGSITILTLERLVLSPLRILSTTINKIGKSGDLSIRVPVKGSDELAALAAASNKMLSDIQSYQDELRKSEYKYRHLFESMLDGFAYCQVIINEKNQISDCIFVEVNEAFEEVAGIIKDDLLGKSISEVKFKFDISDISGKDMLARTVFNGEKIKFELHSEWNDRYYLVSAYCPGDTYFIALFKDITELKESEEELRRSKEAAEVANVAKSAFLANMSHEIRTPMNAIIGMTELLQESQLNVRQQELVDSVQDAGNLLISIINDILDFSKIEAGKFILNNIKFNLVSVVESVAEIISVKAHEKQLSLMTYISPDIPMLWGDGDRLRQVLLNLVGNAIKFTDNGEIVILATLHDLSEKNAVVAFEVRDTGIGIEEEQQKKLFQPFVQADGSSTRKYGGTGLGLSISKAIIELMNGNVVLDSCPGKGTVVRFTAAFERSGGINKTNEADNELNDLNDLKVLVLSDSESSGNIILKYLESWGIHCRLVFSMKEAIELLNNGKDAEDRFDIAIVDTILYPTKEHYEFPKHTDVDSILIAVCSPEGSGEAALKSGFSACLIKPFKQSQLFDCIVTVMNEHSVEASKNASLKEMASGYEENIVSPGEETGDRLLLVEDNPVNRKLAIMQLERFGLSIDTACNGKEALEKMMTKRYNIILMDCQMPVMDGFEATRAIRKRQATLGYHAVIVAMTANAMDGDREKCLAAGMDDYISKPVRVQNLSDIFEKWNIKSNKH